MPSKKKAPARKSPTKKSAARKSPAKASPAKKRAAAKSAPKKSAVKKSATKKSTTKKGAAKSPRQAAPERTAAAADSLAAETAAAPRAAAAKAAPPAPAPKLLFQDAGKDFKKFKRRIYAPTRGQTPSGWRITSKGFVCERRYPTAIEYLTLENGFFVPANTRLQLRCKAGWTLGYNAFKKYGDRFQLRVMGNRDSTYLIKAEGKSSGYKSREFDLPPTPVATLYKLEISFHTNPDVPGVSSCQIGDIKVYALPS